MHIYIYLFINMYTPINICMNVYILYCCINAFIFCVRYLCLIGRAYVFYKGHVDKSSLYETLFHRNILSKHHHHHHHHHFLYYLENLDIWLELLFSRQCTYIYIRCSLLLICTIIECCLQYLLSTILPDLNR
jgi:hypothetical protein